MRSGDERDRAIRAFGLDTRAFQPDSIYAFGPVFRGTVNGHDVVIKRTRSPLEAAEGLIAWTRALAARGIDVVTPDDDIDPNPVEVDGEIWLAYPFIHGVAYSALASEVHAAGALLGAIHAASVVVEPPFARFTFPVDDPGSTEEDLRALEAILAEHELPRPDAIIGSYARKLRELFDEYAPALQRADVPWVLGPWDYKANNLVYAPSGPVLVDPDSAGSLPRLLDLALAALLFHNEHAEAPGRLFSDNEWRTFYDGYAEHVRLTREEVALWPIALEFMRLEEGLWLMLHDDQGWRSGRQRSFLIDLLTADVGRFVL